MAFPSYPNPARRARILEAQQLRMEGLTMRRIAERMSCSVSTVHGYLRDFELFRSDLIQELAADQIVAHLIQLGDLDDPHHDRRRADLHELRLLLTSLPQIRRDESDRSVELLQSGVAVDRYGQRYAKADRLHPPTPEETEQMQQADPPVPDLDPVQPLAFIPEPSRTEPNATEQPHNPDPTSVAPSPTSDVPDPASDAPRPDAGPSASSMASGTESPSPQPTPNDEANCDRTQPNNTERKSAPNPAQDGKSAVSDQNSPPPELQRALDDIERQLQEVLRHRDWLNDYPEHNPSHPQRQRALRLMRRKKSLLALARSRSENPDAA